VGGFIVQAVLGFLSFSPEKKEFARSLDIGDRWSLNSDYPFKKN